jgi:hypothetical protein
MKVRLEHWRNDTDSGADWVWNIGGMILTVERTGYGTLAE